MKEDIKALQSRAVNTVNPGELIDIEVKLGIWFVWVMEMEQEAFEKYLMYEQDRKYHVSCFISNSKDSATKAKEIAFTECIEYYKTELEWKVKYNGYKLDRMALDSFIDILKQKVSHYKNEYKTTKNQV